MTIFSISYLFISDQLFCRFLLLFLFVWLVILALFVLVGGFLPVFGRRYCFPLWSIFAMDISLPDLEIRGENVLQTKFDLHSLLVSLPSATFYIDLCYCTQRITVFGVGHWAFRILFRSYSIIRSLSRSDPPQRFEVVFSRSYSRSISATST